MTILMVPELDAVPYPTLGGLVCDFIEENLVFGPGDLRGEPARIDAEKRALLYRMYELFPQGHPQAGRRRFKRVALSLRKGSAKSEFAAWLAAVELHPEGPVRCIGWDGHGNPIGGGVTDPFIPMCAYTEDQSEELAYGALKTILEESELRKDFDIGLERIVRIHGGGKAVPTATAPNSTDGARTTFQVFDESHRLSLPRLKAAHRTMLANIPKRKLADAWSFEITTAFAPGEGSVAEDTMDYAKQVGDGKIKDSSLFFFHRQASDSHDLTTDEGIRAAVIEASGPVAEWSDIDGIVDQWKDPTADRAYLERVWLNRLVRSSERAFDAEQWRKLADLDFTPPNGDLITLGFDGARYHDSTALIGTHIATGYQWVIGIWERPLNIEKWEVPEHEVELAVDEAFRRWEVWRLYADPPYWETKVSEWCGKYGEERVMQWYTNRFRQMTYALRGYDNAIKAGELSHDGNRLFAAHIGNACRHKLTLRDDQGEPLWIIYKERPDSPHKIDAAMAACLSWEARNDAIADGVMANQESVYDERARNGEEVLVVL